jgi:tetratricopeptide (TPR) repeat protein
VRFLNARLAAFERLKDESSAQAEIEDFLKVAPTSASAYLDLAKIHGRANRRKDMIDALRRAFDSDEKNSSAAFMLGMNLSNSATADYDDLREAERALDRAVLLLPKNEAARKRRGIVRRSLADFAGAVADLEFAAAATTKDDPAAADTRAMLEDAKRDLAMRRRIGDVLEGKTLPLTKAEWTELTAFCATKKIHRTESELLRRALAVSPSPFDDPAGREIFSAARATIRALSNIGVERLSEPDPSDERRWIEAADRFREASHRLASSVESGAIAPSFAAEIAGRWCDDPEISRLHAHFPDGHPKKAEIRDTLTRLSALRAADASDSRPTR